MRWRKYMQTLGEQPAELSVEEQNLLLAAYKNAVGSRRGESDIITSVELPSCVSKDDLIYDGDLTKCRLKESSVWKKPKTGDEVKMSMKVTKLDGSVYEKHEFEYTVDDGSLGLWATAIDKVLGGMLRVRMRSSSALRSMRKETPSRRCA